MAFQSKSATFNSAQPLDNGYPYIDVTWDTAYSDPNKYRVVAAAVVTDGSGVVAIAFKSKSTTGVRVLVSDQFSGVVELTAYDVIPQASEIAPVVAGYTPNHAEPDKAIVIAGVRFTGTTAVAFNGTAAYFTLVDDSTIIATVPESATTGVVAVTTSNGTGMGPTFTIDAFSNSELLVTSGRYPSATQSLDLSVRLAWNTGDAMPLSGTVFEATGPSGTFSLALDGAGSTVVTARGSTALSSPVAMPMVGNNSEIDFRYIYDAQGFSDHSILLRVNGYEIWPGGFGQGGPSGPAISTPTGVGFGKKANGTSAWPAPVVNFVSAGRAHVATLAEFIVVGDSTSAYSTTWKSVGSAIYSAGERWTRAGIFGTAAGGDTIASQKAKWTNASCDQFRASSTKAFLIMLGVNDIIFGSNAATVLAALQDLINTFKADVATAKIVIAPILPARGYLTGGQYTVWQGVNSGLSGLTSVDVVQSAISALNDGSDFLAAAYNTGDNLHENNAGRDLVAAAYRASLVSLGLL